MQFLYFLDELTFLMIVLFLVLLENLYLTVFGGNGSFHPESPEFPILVSLYNNGCFRASRCSSVIGREETAVLSSSSTWYIIGLAESSHQGLSRELLLEGAGGGDGVCATETGTMGLARVG